MPSNEFDNQRVVVMGLGRFGGGIAVTRFLAERGARVLVTDRAEANLLRESMDKLRDLPVEYRLGEHRESDLDDADLLVLSPAVDRKTSAFYQAAIARGLPWTTEMNLFLERCRARIMGITGTIGKSTTTAMVHAILAAPETRAALGHRQALLGGNIGQSLLGHLGDLTADDVVVLELSSFQLDVVQPDSFQVQVAGLTNVKPHHLDRHGTFESYFEAKLKLFRALAPGGGAVVGAADEVVTGRVRDAAAGVRVVVTGAPDETYDLRVPGRHNQVNAHMALALAGAMGVGRDVARAALQSFGGLPHRLAFVAERDGVRYYNDSKSTSAEAIDTALAAFSEPVVLLCGGKDIGAELDRVVDAPWDGVRAVVCFGDAGPRLAELIRPVVPASASVEVGGALSASVVVAQRRAHAGDVVILSPGCPSYDAFVNYEARGDCFVQQVCSAG